MVDNKTALDKRQEIRLAAESDLETFIKLVAPHRVLGAVHQDLCSWWTRADAKSHQLALIPRDHGKSAMVAYRTAWHITKYPDCRIIYMSATSNLAIKQLKFIKDILTSDKYKLYWPEMVNESSHDREKWTETEISVDHPLRKQEGVRDSTVTAVGLTTSITGLHCDVSVFDDIVVNENAYTKEGRDKCKFQYSLLASIAGTNSKEWVVGTRYHPKDLYDTMLNIKEEIYNDEMEIVSEDPMYEVFQKEVEDNGDGTGEFLWPVQKRTDGKVFGFNAQILAKKRAQYREASNMRQFYAQYYNDPSRGDSGAINRDKFQYYDQKFLDRKGGVWYYGHNRLNVYASIDFAFSVKKKADYTVVVVIGVDAMNNIYVLDIERLKTDVILDYYEAVKRMFIKWDFRKLRAEVSSAQSVIVKQLKENYIKRFGLALSIDEYRPSRYDGSKEERIQATLGPRYDNLQMWHYRGGNCQVLEEELTQSNPAHDDIKDALASAVQIATAPSQLNRNLTRTSKVQYHNRFGGII